MPSSGSRELWVEVLKNGPSKICGKQPLKNLRWYGCLTQILLGPFLNTLIHVLSKPKQADVIITREQKRLENTILSTYLKRLWLYSVGCGSVTCHFPYYYASVNLCVNFFFHFHLYLSQSMWQSIYIPIYTSILCISEVCCYYRRSLFDMKKQREKICFALQLIVFVRKR